MVQWVQRAKENIFNSAAEKKFIDPITGKGPTSEVALSCLLVLYQNKRLINWNAVPLYNLDRGREGTGNELFSIDGYTFSEYALLCPTEEDVKDWGNMRADIMHFNNNLDKLDKVVLIENKIGGVFTFGSRPEDGQLARQLKYLMKYCSGESYLVVLTLEDMYKHGWYINEFKETVRFHKPPKNIKCRMMLWEDIINYFSG